MERRRKDRNLEFLYNCTEVIQKPKITSVLSGSYPMRGPVEETEQVSEKNMLPLQIEKRLDKCSMRRNVHGRAESGNCGTCNVCSAPCSSCMHLKLPYMGSKVDGISDENSRVTSTSQNSVNGESISPFVNKSPETLQHPTSEASNVNSSHDSLSENAESKANIRCFDMTDALGESEILPELPFDKNAVVNQHSAGAQCMLHQKNFIYEYTNVVDRHDDSLSCSSRANDANRSLNLHSKNVEKKSLSGGSILVSSLESEGSEKALISPKPELSETPSNSTDVGTSSPKSQGGFLSSITNDTNMEEYINLDDSKVSSEFYPKTEVEIKEDSGAEDDVKFKCSKMVEQDENSNNIVELPDMQKHASQPVSGDESDESEIIEHDVKVCDICGDAGRDDLLAICSKCSDGAEHIYCMREMLQKVPDGEWLCEECLLAEETENQKQDVERKTANGEIALNSMKRHAETVELASTPKRKAIESKFGSFKSSSPSKTAVVTQDNSIKNLVKGKAKLVHQSSFASHSSVRSLETARPSLLSPQIQTSKGTLLESRSFNTLTSKSKVKLVNDVPQKQKGHRDIDMKEGTARMLSKSTSFRAVNLGCSNVSESKVKMVSPKFSQAQDMKGLKQLKERSALGNKSFSKLDLPLGNSVTSSNAFVSKVNQKLTPHGESVKPSSICNNGESKASQHDGKSDSLLRSTSSLSHKVAEISPSSVRSVSTNQVSPKEEPSASSSWTVERPSHNVDDHLPDGSSRSWESSDQNYRIRESSLNCSRPGIATGSKNITCHKCKEIGHVAEFCSITSPRSSVAAASAERSFRDDMGKCSYLKAETEAAMLKKPGILGKKRGSDLSDGLSSSIVDVSEIASHQVPVSNEARKMTHDEGRDEGQASIGSSTDTSKQIDSNDVKQLNCSSADAVISFEVRDLDPVVPSVGKADPVSTAKPLFSMMLTIPEHEYIWQGSLEVHRNERLPHLYNGIQAHLSTSASPKVLRMVNQFPHKIIMDEVPRISTWPRQFHDYGAKEDNIALYFFAEDPESYEKSYKNLLDNMIKRDLALKVSFDGVDFLIFPSTQLPENSQRWNMLFFLWGVFWGRRSSWSKSLTKSIVPGSDVVPMDIHNHDQQCTVLRADLDNEGMSSQSETEHQNDGLGSKSILKNATNSTLLFSENRYAGRSQEDVQKSSSQAAGGYCSSNSREETQKHVDASCASEGLDSVKVSQSSKQDRDSRVIIDEETLGNRMDIDRHEVKVERDLNEDPPNIDAEASSDRDETVREHDSLLSSRLDLSNKAPKPSITTTQKLPWVIVNDTIKDAVGNNLKPHSVSQEKYGCSNRDETSLADDFSPQKCDFGCSSSVEKKSCEKRVDEKVIHEDFGTAERYFFPVESCRVKDFQMGATSMPWKGCSSTDENQFQEVVPNLELGLGAETSRLNKATVPSLIRTVDGEIILNRIPHKEDLDKEEEDTVHTSLSLSLSLPFPEKEQTVKPVSTTELLLPERRHVNTARFLFGGFSDK